MLDLVVVSTALEWLHLSEMLLKQPLYATQMSEKQILQTSVDNYKIGSYLVDFFLQIIPLTLFKCTWLFAQCTVIQEAVYSTTPWIPLSLSFCPPLAPLSTPTCPPVCPATCPHIHVSRCQSACLSVCMSLFCPDCLVHSVWEAGKTMREYATPISTSDTGKVAPSVNHKYARA